jgi:nuclear GTP-binding protein
MPEDIKDPMKNLEKPDDIENIEFNESEENQDVDDANANDADASWNEVFNAGSGSEIESDQESTKNNSEDSESFSESCNESENSESENLPNTLQNGSKIRRMTTNKKKATNYYTNANVKNKNKSKKGKVNFKKSLPKRK